MGTPPTTSIAKQVVFSAASAGLRPDPLLTVSQWADQYRVLSTLTSAEPGQWRTSRTPYLREIMDCLSPSSSYERVVFIKGSQLGGTECGNNWIGYIIHQAPGPVMMVQPSLDMAKKNSKHRIDALIEDSPALSKLLRPPGRLHAGADFVGRLGSLGRA